MTQCVSHLIHRARNEVTDKNTITFQFPYYLKPQEVDAVALTINPELKKMKGKLSTGHSLHFDRDTLVIYDDKKSNNAYAVHSRLMKLINVNHAKCNGVCQYL